jgi:hypothetical protein
MPSRRQSNSQGSPSERRHPRQNSRLDGMRTGLHQLFNGRSTVGPRNPTLDSPKSPRFVLGLPNLSTTRLNVPYLDRTPSVPRRSNTQRSNSSPTPSPSRSPQTPSDSRPSSPESLRLYIQQPPVSVAPSHVRHHSARRFVGVDPAELHLAELAQSGRGRRRHKSRNRERTCAPKIKNRKIRAKILSCFVSGMVCHL